MARKILFIGLVWPEPNSTAAGTRIMQLVKLFLANGDEVHFASAAAKSAFSFPLASLEVSEHQISLNNSSFDVWISDLNANVVIYDRFMIEEQYGWRIKKMLPNALTILDTEDLHFLRHGRQVAYKQNRAFKEHDLYNEITKREIASILRCDLTLIISQVEMQLLKQFQVPDTSLFYLPFLEEEISQNTQINWLNFEDRKDVIFIGNYLHEPNWQTLLYLKTKVWPKLRKALPGVNLNIYGAYAGEKVLQLHNAKENFLVHGRAENAQTIISQHRILLAPLLFGAGAKGKFIDAMQTGTPIVSTTIGAESMQGEYAWPGFVTDDLEELVEKTVKLYQDAQKWNELRLNGIQIINQLYAKQNFIPDFLIRLNEVKHNLTQHRQQHFLGEILHHHTLQSAKYLSLWIEEKNK